MLQAAHRGYDYQDLLVATLLTDLLVGQVAAAWVDEKFVPDDLFDDLTTTGSEGFRRRAQFKHRDTETPLSLATFTNDSRDLRLDRLAACAIADREGPGKGAVGHEYRLVLRDKRPIDPRLILALKGDRATDPGPFVPHMPTVRLRFDLDAIWPTSPPTDEVARQVSNTFAFLRSGNLQRTGVKWFCEHFVVEVEAPTATFDLDRPGPAEELLLSRLRRDVGAESYPNHHRSAMDVAAAMIVIARAARAGSVRVSASELLRRCNLRRDFGAVARAYPIVADIEVPRPTTANDIVSVAEDTVRQGRSFLLIEGPPGHGKSWACQRVVDALKERKWLVADHYCFLGDADKEKEARVLSESVIGSLLGGLGDADPDLVVSQKPRYAADEQALIEALRRAHENNPNRRVALVIDGIDHVTRVLGATVGRPDPSRLLAEHLSTFKQLQGTVLIVFSQPGDHLKPFIETGVATPVEMPGLDINELETLAERWGVVSSDEGAPVPKVPRASDANTPRSPEQEKLSTFLRGLLERSRGNALYATYLCREVLRSASARLDPVGTLSALPAFDGTLAAYYEYLMHSIGDGRWIAEMIALLDFSVTRSELREIRPEMAHRVDAAIEQLKPVVVEKATQGGIRVYHESFSRFLLGPLMKVPVAMSTQLSSVADWLKKKGLFVDARAFRFLLPTLARLGNDREIVMLVNEDFVVNSVASAFTEDAIRQNLAVAVTSATNIGDWPSVVRCLELGRAAATYQYERLDSVIVQFADIVMGLLGADVFAQRLLHDGRTTVPARTGLELCNEIDKAGAVAPWEEYLDAFERERKNDNTAYGEEADRHISLCILRGRLSERSNEPNAIDLPRLAKWIDQSSLSPASVVDILWDKLEEEKAATVVSLVTESGAYALALAERFSKSQDVEDRDTKKRQWALTALSRGLSDGDVNRILDLGISVDDVHRVGVHESRERLLALAESARHERAQFEVASVEQWLDACAIAARRDPFGLAAAEALFQGEGWYRCWLRFTTALCRAEVAPKERQPHEALQALMLLTDDLRPFVGNPRACDLWGLRNVLAATIRRVLALLDDATWESGIKVLVRVSDETSTTIWGELGGPVPRDFLLQLVVEHTNSNRHAVCWDIVSSVLGDAGGRRYYSDVAKFHLTAARLALRSNSQADALHHWRSAATFLAAYGYRRDITLYELLDSIPSLIAFDGLGVRRRLSVLQALCDRVLVHTDGKDTSRVYRQWWSLLGEADPEGLANLVVPALFRNCNMPRSQLEDARADMWRKQFRNATPIISAAFRLTLPGGLISEDPDVLRYLEAGVAAETQKTLMQSLVARADERPMSYPYSNSDELIAKDNNELREINDIATRNNLTRILSFNDEDRVKREKSPSESPTRWDPAESAEVIESVMHADLDRGARDVLAMIATWRRRPYKTPKSRWSLDRFANFIGFRVQEFLEQGNWLMAEAVIRAVADAAAFDIDCGLLAAIAEGLDMRGFTDLATVAHVLTWTRSRGRGGWLMFGGETRLESLRRAAQLNKNLAMSTLASEVVNLVRTGGVSYGATKAIVIAFSKIDLSPVASTATDTAFAIWDEAARIVSKRLPRVSDWDDPDLPYIPLSTLNDSREHIEDRANRAFILCIFGGLSHPAREQKRRALVAIEVIATEHPEQAAEGFRLAFATLAEPTNLCWLLRSLHDSSGRDVIIARCATELRQLGSSSFITVRSLARSLLALGNIDPGPLPYYEADQELQNTRRSKIVVPHRTQEIGKENEQPASDSDADHERQAELIIADLAKNRIKEAEHALPGLRAAVHARLTRSIFSENYKRRLKNQLEGLCSAADRRWPDAFIVPNEMLEEVLQKTASGGRSFLASAGSLVTDPVSWELNLARLLENDSVVAKGLERLRIARPPYPFPPSWSSPIWKKLSEERDPFEYDPSSPDGTSTQRPASECDVVQDGEYAGWRTIALLETRSLQRDRTSMDRTEVTVSKYGAIEYQKPGDDRILNFPSASKGDVRIWMEPIRVDTIPDEPEGSIPLFGIDRNCASLGDGMSGLGYPIGILTPVPRLVVALGLRPSELFRLSDKRGVAVAARAWRARYVTSDYELCRPTIRGMDVVMRPDVFASMLSLYQIPMQWREYVNADAAMHDQDDHKSDNNG